MIVKLASTIGKLHGRFFAWLSVKAESHPMWALLLTLVALYEIFEHIVLPLLAGVYFYLAATGKL